MWQAMVGHAWTHPMFEGIGWIVWGPLNVALQNGDGSASPGQAKTNGKARRASADDYHFVLGHPPPPRRSYET
jgi:hypothetical protein